MPSSIHPRFWRKVRRIGRTLKGRENEANSGPLNSSTSESLSFASSTPSLSNASSSSTPLSASGSISFHPSASGAIASFSTPSTSPTYTPLPNPVVATSTSLSSVDSLTGTSTQTTLESGPSSPAENATFTVQSLNVTMPPPSSSSSSTSSNSGPPTSSALDSLSSVSSSGVSSITTGSDQTLSSSSSLTTSNSLQSFSSTSSSSRIGPITAKLSRSSELSSTPTSSKIRSSSFSPSETTRASSPSLSFPSTLSPTRSPSSVFQTPSTAPSLGTIHTPSDATTTLASVTTSHVDTSTAGTSVNASNAPPLDGHTSTPVILAGVFGGLGGFIILLVLLFFYRHYRGRTSSFGWPRLRWRSSRLLIQMPSRKASKRDHMSSPLIAEPNATYGNGMAGPLSSTSQTSNYSQTNISPKLMVETKRLTLQRMEGAQGNRYTLGSSPSDFGDDPFADPFALSRARAIMDTSPTIRGSNASQVDSSGYAGVGAAMMGSGNPFSDPNAADRGGNESPIPPWQVPQGRASPSRLRYEATYAV
ncbi:unnamed protein product [Somion occarium]|uniref:Uncharacterized protein n=1 Tax=Somion occarium TaxID=3059160 RepID=A0ABP1CEL2_9APHY